MQKVIFPPCFSLVGDVFRAHPLWEKADFVSKLELNTVLHEVSAFFMPFC